MHACFLQSVFASCGNARLLTLKETADALGASDVGIANAVRRGVFCAVSVSCSTKQAWRVLKSSVCLNLLGCGNFDEASTEFACAEIFADMTDKMLARSIGFFKNKNGKMQQTKKDTTQKNDTAELVARLFDLPEKRWLTPREIAECLGVSAVSVLTAFERGEFWGVKSNWSGSSREGCAKIARDSVVGFLLQRCNFDSQTYLKACESAFSTMSKFQLLVARRALDAELAKRK